MSSQRSETVVKPKPCPIRVLKAKCRSLDWKKGHDATYNIVLGKVSVLFSLEVSFASKMKVLPRRWTS